MEVYTKQESYDEVSVMDSYISYVDSITEDVCVKEEDFLDGDEVSDPSWEPRTGEVPEDTDEQTESEFDVVPHKAKHAQASKRARNSGRGRRATETGQRWYDDQDPDITPPQPIFRPLRSPGSQLISIAEYSFLDLFKLFFTNKVLRTIVKNTNEHGRAHYNKPSEPWTEITLQDMFSFLSIVIYMGLVRAPALADYWRTSSLYSFPFTRNTITGKKFLTILRALHLSSAAQDNANEKKRDTGEFDRLGKIKPLYTEMREACKRNYHPHQHISVDERMVASKARIGFKQYIKSKPTRWGFKLFVLADSKTGYTWDYFIYEGKTTEATGKGLGYDSVMKLVNPSVLGTGYKLYVDNFYTSTTLLRDLYQQRIWACGTMRVNGAGYPKTLINALDAKSPRGSIRWFRDDLMLFVQWRDARDVTLCSTIHTAHGADKAKRKKRNKEGQLTSDYVPIPPAVKDYNQHMGGVDLSDQLIGYYGVLHKTRKWYKTFFFHFVDIAIVNAFILYKAQCQVKGQVPTHQKKFRETLALELSRVGSQKSTPQEEDLEPHHRLVHIAETGDKTTGRLRCRKCQAKTAVKCVTCNMPLCFVAKRDCYNDWHREDMMCQ